MSGQGLGDLTLEDFDFFKRHYEDRLFGEVTSGLIHIPTVSKVEDLDGDLVAGWLSSYDNPTTLIFTPKKLAIEIRIPRWDFGDLNLAGDNELKLGRLVIREKIAYALTIFMTTYIKPKPSIWSTLLTVSPPTLSLYPHFGSDFNYYTIKLGVSVLFYNHVLNTVLFIDDNYKEIPVSIKERDKPVRVVRLSKFNVRNIMPTTHYKSQYILGYKEIKQETRDGL